PAAIGEYASAEQTLSPIMLDANDAYPTAPLQVSQVHYDTLDGTTFDVMPTAEVGTLAKVGAIYTDGSDALRNALASDYANRAGNGNRTQVRIRIGADTCDDRAAFDRP